MRPGVRRALIASACLAILIHVSGINTIIDYAPKIFLSAGFKVDGALISTFFVGVNNVLFTLVAFWVIDRYGRKPLYIVGSLGMAVALAGLLIAVARRAFPGPSRSRTRPALSRLFRILRGARLLDARSRDLSQRRPRRCHDRPVLLQWVANAVVVLYFPTAFDSHRQSSYLRISGADGADASVFTWRFVPETKNKPLEEIEQYWVARS